MLNQTLQALRRASLALALFGLASCLLTACASDFSVSGRGYQIDTMPRLEGSPSVSPGVAMIVTGEGAQILGDNAELVARSLLGQDESGPLDLSGPVNSYLEGAGLTQGDFTVRDVELSLEIRRSPPQITFLPDPTRVRLSLEEVWIRAEGTATSESLGSFACRIRGRVDRNTTRQRMFTLTDLVVELSLTENEGRYEAQVSTLNFNILDSGLDVVADSDDPDYYCNFPECSDGSCAECHAICGGASLLESAVNFFAEYLDGLIAEGLENLVEDSLGGFERLSGEADLAVLLGSLLPDLLDSERVAVEVKPAKTGFSVVGQGDLAAQLDLASGPLVAHPCIGPDPGAPALTAGPPPATEALGLPRPHVAVGLSVQTLNQLIWGVYRAGGLCLQVSSQDVTQLSNGFVLNADTLSLVFPGLTRVIGDDAPLLLSLQPRLDPQAPQVIRLGTGLGEGEARESLVQASLPPLELSLFAWIEGRWLRLFGVDAGLELGVSPVLRTDQVVDLSLDRIEITGLTETYNELFPGQDLGQIFQLVVELALGMVAGQGFELPIPLEELLTGSLGLPLTIDITDLRPAGNQLDWLLLGARFELVGAQESSRPTLETVASSLQEGPLWPGQPLVVQAQALDIAGMPLEDAEVQWRVDQGPWRGFVSAGRVEVESHLLRTPGLHTVSLRARVRGQWRSLDLSPTQVQVRVLSLEEMQAAPSEPAAAPAPASSQASGCSVGAGSPRGTSSWAWLLLGLVCLPWRRRLALLTLAGLGLLGTACSGDKKNKQQEELESCTQDADCAQGQRCGCGVCYEASPCTQDAQCCAGQSCQGGACTLVEACQDDSQCGDGATCQGCQCHLPACDDDGDCAFGQSCQAGACVLPERFPCPTGCDPGEACVGELQLCIPAPAACAQMDCLQGQALVVTNPEVVMAPACSLEAATCACEGALAPVVSGDPTGYLKAVALPNGDIVIAAYDVALRDLTVRTLPADSAEPGPVLYLDGHGSDNDTVPGNLRGNLGQGPDVGAELDLAVAADGTLGLVARDRTNKVLRFYHSQDGQSWTRVDVDSDGEGGRNPDLEAAPGGGWVIAYQSQVELGGGDWRTALKVASSTVNEVFATPDFDIAVLDATTTTVTYPDLPSGTGVTPSLGFLDGRWFVAYHDARSGELKLATWAGAPQNAELSTLISPVTRSGLEAGSTGLAPHILAGAGGSLDIIYLDVTSGELRHASFVYQNGQASLGEITVVDPGLSGAPQRALAQDASLTRTASGTLVAVYQDTTLADLYISTSQGNSWSTRVEDATGSTGFFPQVIHQGQESILIYGRWLFPQVGKIEQKLVVRSLPVP